MRFLVLFVGVSLLTVGVVATSAAADSPCGPNVQRCDPPCRTGRIQDCLPDPCAT